MSSLRRHGLVFAAFAALAVLIAAFGAASALRTGALVGLGAGIVSGLVSLFFVAKSAERGLQPALVALVSGFLIRMVLVAAALLVARAVGGDALGCAAAFFGLYVIGQALEVALVSARSRAEERSA